MPQTKAEFYQRRLVATATRVDGRDPSFQKELAAQRSRFSAIAELQELVERGALFADAEADRALRVTAMLADVAVTIRRYDLNSSAYYDYTLGASHEGRNHVP